MDFHDAHNHLQDARFGGAQDALVAAALGVGVRRMVVNGSCEEDWPEVAALARRHPAVLPSFGLHPWYVAGRTPHWREKLEEHLDAMPSAVGEFGLDRWKPGLAWEGQEEVFVAQLEIAARRGRPASLHCLQAWGRLLDLLRSHARPACGFVLHSFGGAVEMVGPLAKLGAYFSFPGYYMHPRKTRNQETFRRIPIDRLLVETDAPDQPLPEESITHPLRAAGTDEPINHPAKLPAVYRFLAGLRGMEPGALAAEVGSNFARVFGGL